MTTASPLLTTFITSINTTINDHEAEVTELDRVIGDGDHVVNLQRGLNALIAMGDELDTMEYSAAFMKIGMILMSTMGGASGSLFGTLFVKMGKTATSKEMKLETFAEVFSEGVEAVKQRGKADLGEKTMLDTLIPVANSLQQSAQNNESLATALEKLKLEAIKGMESTKEMLATKGRASF